LTRHRRNSHCWEFGVEFSVGSSWFTWRILFSLFQNTKENFGGKKIYFANEQAHF
jgi:hypothetical protein